MAKSSKSSGTKKAPRADARPFLHKGTGRWAKKCRGKLVYLGYQRDDPEGKAAWARWLEIRDDARAGRAIGRKTAALTVAGLCNEYLNARRRHVKSGELSARSFRDLSAAAERLATVGKSREAASIGPADFERLRQEILKHCGPVRAKVEITKVRGIFRWAVKQGLLDHLPRYGAAFDPPTAKTLRLSKATKGARHFTPEQIKLLLAKADSEQRAWILLALNCGYGPSDLSAIPQSALNLDTGWADFPRVKTGVNRRCWLWPETREAVAAAIASRPRPADPAGADCVFLNKRGQLLVRTFSKGAMRDAVGYRFASLLARCGLDGKGLSFYRLRHTHRHIADSAGDQPAADALMGHVDNSMPGNYRGGVDDDRLKRIAEHIRQWLFPADDTGTGDGEPLVAAIARCRAAIDNATGADKTALVRAWAAEIELAATGDATAVGRVMERWGEHDQDAEPATVKFTAAG